MIRSIWNNEFVLRYSNWDDLGKVDNEVIEGSYRDAIHRARDLVIKLTPPKKGSRREVEIYLGDCFLKAIG